MARQYTEADLQQVNEAQEKLRAKGLTDDQFQQAIDLLREYFEANPGVPITSANVVQFVEAQPGLKWLTPAELEFRNLSARLNEDQNATLHTFLQNNRLEIAGDPGVQNSV